MYILKTKGTAKIPDYVQIRDDNFVLICHVRADKPDKALAKHDFKLAVDDIVKIINELSFGILKKVDL